MVGWRSGGWKMTGWKWTVPVLVAAAGLIALPLEESRAATADNSTPNELSGAEMYRTYCAACHGIDGKGSGPAASALKTAPPDLTLISRRNNGQFPAFRITHIIDGYEVTAVHGSREMPIWGDYFRDRKRDETILALREHNLTEYIRSIQQK